MLVHENCLDFGNRHAVFSALGTISIIPVKT